MFLRLIQVETKFDLKLFQVTFNRSYVRVHQVELHLETIPVSMM